MATNWYRVGFDEGRALGNVRCQPGAQYGRKAIKAYNEGFDAARALEERAFSEYLDSDTSHLSPTALPADAFCDEHYAEMVTDDVQGAL